jgi:hypothetical protein
MGHQALVLTTPGEVPAVSSECEALPSCFAPLDTALVASVVVINFNYGAFLAQAIDSALGQTYPHVEVIVVDDGSTDGSGALLEEYERRARILRKSNGGHVSAVNAGVAASRGDLVILLDADDFLYSDCVAHVVSAWRSGAAKIQFRLDTINGAGLDQQMPFPAYTHDLDADEILRRAVRTGYYPWPVSSGNAFARSFLQQVMPIDASRFFKSPDGYLNKMAPLYGPVLTLHATLGAYRVHGGNAWAQAAGGVKAGTYVRGTCFDAVLHAAFIEAARMNGHAVPPFDRARVPQWVEVRLLSLRLDGASHPFPKDSAAGVWWIGIRAAAGACGLTPSARVLWMLWFTALALMPRAYVARLAARWRPQAHRSWFARRLIALSRSFGRARR